MICKTQKFNGQNNSYKCPKLSNSGIVHHSINGIEGLINPTGVIRSIGKDVRSIRSRIRPN